MNKKQFVIVLIITFTVIVIWIIADIIYAQPSVPLNPKAKTLLDPVNPTFDKTTLDQIKNKGQITPFKESTKSAQSTSSAKPR